VQTLFWFAAALLPTCGQDYHHTYDVATDMAWNCSISTPGGLPHTPPTQNISPAGIPACPHYTTPPRTILTTFATNWTVRCAVDGRYTPTVVAGAAMLQPFPQHFHVYYGWIGWITFLYGSYTPMWWCERAHYRYVTLDLQVVPCPSVSPSPAAPPPPHGKTCVGGQFNLSRNGR